MQDQNYFYWVPLYAEEKLIGENKKYLQKAIILKTFALRFWILFKI